MAKAKATRKPVAVVIPEPAKPVVEVKALYRLAGTDRVQLMMPAAARALIRRGGAWEPTANPEGLPVTEPLAGFTTFKDWLDKLGDGCRRDRENLRTLREKFEQAKANAKPVSVAAFKPEPDAGTSLPVKTTVTGRAFSKKSNLTEVDRPLANRPSPSFPLSACNVCRWGGANGYAPEQIAQALRALSIGALPDTTIRSKALQGFKGKKVPNVDKATAARLIAAAGKPAKWNPNKKGK